MGPRRASVDLCVSYEFSSDHLCFYEKELGLLGKTARICNLKVL